MKVDYDEFQAEIARLKRDRWLGILAAEPPGRVPGRRPRDPEKERILAELDRVRLAREGLLTRLERQRFAELNLRERDHLQEWLVNMPDVLGEELLILQKEFTDSRRRASASISLR